MVKNKNKNVFPRVLTSVFYDDDFAKNSLNYKLTWICLRVKIVYEVFAIKSGMFA